MSHDQTGDVGIFPGDAVILTAINLFMDDMRANPWLIEDVFRSLIENPILKQKYGLKEVARAKEFIINNKIPVYMRHRVDKQEFPCITVSIGASREDRDLATLGDLDVCVETYLPSDIDKTIQFIIPPFNPVSYTKSTGVVIVPESVEDYRFIDAGMIAVDPQTGNGFIVIEKTGDMGFKIAAGSDLTGTQLAIVPQYQIFKARRERAISQESYDIGCHVLGDPSTLIFLHSVVKYALYRYREGLFEHNNFQLSKISSTDLIKNDAFNIENVYSRWITLSGQVEESWVKTPRRIIEIIDTVDTENSIPGIKILSKNAPEGLVDECDPWITIDE